MSQPDPDVATAKTREVLVRRALIVAVIVLIVFVAGLQLWNTLAIRATQVDNTQRSKVTQSAAISAKRASDRIEDCTTPGRPCYRDAQKRTAKAVGSISDVVILAAACSVGLDPHMSVIARQDRIQACIINRLAAKP